MSDFVDVQDVPRLLGHPLYIPMNVSLFIVEKKS